MSDDETTLVGPAGLSVLYADIAGSTALYEEFGDAKARDATATCVEVMAEVVDKFQGRVVKTIGDEVMAVFHDSSRAIMASTDLQGAVKRAGEDGKFVTGALRIKVGVHYGPGLEEEKDVFGEAAIVAQQIINLAKADQTLVSGALLNAVPAMLRMSSRFFEHVPSESSGETIEVHELIWEVSELTQVADTAPAPPRPSMTELTLTYGGQSVKVNADNPTLIIGRVEGNDLVVPTDLTSRQHASVEYKRGRFYLTDNSSNGTVVVAEDGGVTTLRRENVALKGTGKLCLGAMPESNPNGIIEFECH